MTTTFAALIFRPEDVSSRALSQGFAVALGGYDVLAPYLLIAPLRGLTGWSAAFYFSGIKLTPATMDEEFEHACDLFEDELSPAVGVLDAAKEEGRPDAVVYELIYTEDFLHDDAWRFGDGGDARHFVRETDDGIEAGVETAAESTAIPIEAEPAGARDATTRGATPDAAHEHRGSTFLARELGAPVIGPLMGALFAPEHRVEVRLVEPSPEAIANEVGRLNEVLRREGGRAAFRPPESVRGVRTPPAYEAFVRAYDWADPSDPHDLYRELAIGAIEGTLHFLREPALRELDADEGWTGAAAGLFPIATRCSSTLGGAQPTAIVALAADGEHLILVTPSARAKQETSPKKPRPTRSETGNAEARPRMTPAGPTFGELLRYLSLGWKRRSEAEEDIIGALMLRARLRSSKE